jgi:site-specific DNA-methyltransferase (adenine-specific)
MREYLNITNEDNMQLMKRYPDNYFDLAIVDPPYGINYDGNTTVKGKAGKASTFSNKQHHEKKDWDNERPSLEYFTELQRVSKHQIIWGANYFVKHLDKGTKGWIIWDKAQHGLTMSDCEIACSSFQKPTRIFTQNRCIFLQEGNTIHPTQKPVKLYEWCLLNYAEQGFKILDTHRGSASLDIACHNLGFDLWTCEIDKEYFDNGNKRLKEHQQQIRMF